MKTAIIVEDQNIIAEDIKRVLLGCGYDVVGTSLSGGRAIDLILNKKPDVAIIDICLDDKVDGFEVIRKSQLISLKTHFIILTCVPEDKKRANGLRLDGYIVKPFTDSSIKECLE